METFEFSTQSTNGVPLYGQGWRPEGEIHAAVGLVHGLGEPSGRYGHVGAALAEMIAWLDAQLADGAAPAGAAA